jgi:hypothetical protein
MGNTCYPIQCPGGFSVGTKGGRFEIGGFDVVVSDQTAAAEFAIVDDVGIPEGQSTGEILTSLTNVKNILAHLKFAANATTGVMHYNFPDPIKVRYGVSIYGNNWVAGNICVYRY